MKIPKRVKIGGLIYEIKYEKNLNRDRKSFGESCVNTQIISIDPDNTQQMQDTTFLHEILHQLDFVYDLGMTHKLIYQLEAALFAFIKDNLGILK